MSVNRSNLGRTPKPKGGASLDMSSFARGKGKKTRRGSISDPYDDNKGKKNNRLANIQKKTGGEG